MSDPLHKTPRTDAELEKPKVELRGGAYNYTEPWSGLVSADFARELERDYWEARRDGYIVAMALLQSVAWKNLEDDERAAAEGFLPKSLRATP